MAKALLKGYFAGLKEGNKKCCDKRDKGVKLLHNTRASCMAIE